MIKEPESVFEEMQINFSCSNVNWGLTKSKILRYTSTFRFNLKHWISELSYHCNKSKISYTFVPKELCKKHYIIYREIQVYMKFGFIMYI